MSALFNIGDAVWFKRKGSTPFVYGSSTDEKAEVGKELSGRGKAEISLSPSQAGIGKAMGVPQIVTGDFPGAIDSTGTVISEGPDAPVAPAAAVEFVFGVVDPGSAGHSYLQTNVTAQGESLPSPASASVVSSVVVPNTIVGTAGAGAGMGSTTANYPSYKVTFVNATGETLPSAASAVVAGVVSGSNAQVALTVVPKGPTGTTSRKIYRNKSATPGTWFLQQTITDNIATTGVTDATADASLGAAAPTTDASGGAKVLVTLTPGPVGTTSRNLYRNKIADQTHWFKIVANTVNDNTTATYEDNIADSALTATQAPSVLGTTTNATIGTTGINNGVVEQITSGHPLAPGKVSTDGIFDGPTPAQLFADALDEGATENASKTNTIRKQDPNQPSGSPANTKTLGTKLTYAGPNPYGHGKVDAKTSPVGIRLPSSEEGPGIVVEVITVKGSGTKTPDGTAVKSGGFVYSVNWGASVGSQPHTVKWRNRMRVTQHAEADLVAR